MGSVRADQKVGGMRAIALAGLMTWIVLACSPAMAQQSEERVSVLGIESAEGDLEFVRNLTGALRHAASQMPGWSVLDQDVSFEQMALAHGCEQPDAACLGLIAQTLEVDRILYGEVRRSSTSANYNFVVSIHIFTTSSGEISRSLSDTVPRVRSDIDQLRERVRRYVSELAGVGQSGTLRVTVEAEGAEVLVDGESRGAVTSGSIALEVPAGRHRVEVVAPGRERFRGTVTVVSGDTAELEVELSHSDGDDDDDDDDGAAPIDEGGSGGSISVPGVVLLGAALVSGGLVLYSWARLQSIDTNPTFQRYRGFVPEPQDACVTASDSLNFDPSVSPADLADVNDLCGEADTLEILQYVFMGTAVATGAIGTYLIVDGLQEEDDSVPTVSLHPSFGTNHGYVEATVRF